ncbi:MAG: tripartite tricarboxylate transporter TctB family protein [Sphaerochaetaceae bacterium]|nr:tripartite tricarboxylate transporter TctB family protein [Sphaerochaetaceae bacterium]
MKDTKKFADLIVGILVIIISIVFFVEAGKLPTQERGIGPGDYPKFVCCLMFILGVIHVIKSVVKGFPLPDFEKTDWLKLAKAATSMLAVFIYYLLLKKVGFLLLTPVLLYSLLLLFGYKKKIMGLVIAVVFSTATYFLFTKVFMVILPRGILG